MSGRAGYARLIGAAGLWLSIASPGRAVDIVVDISNIHSDRGQILVAACPRADFLKLRCPYRAQAPARAGSVTITIADVPPGTYAVQAFQDENNNGKIDRGFLGIPLEGFGFSNNAQSRFGPPGFDDAAIAVGDTGLRIGFRLMYF